MIRPEIVDELRQMFLDGATPSRLIQYIVESNPEEVGIRNLVGDYFEQAFSVPLLRTTVDPDFKVSKEKALISRDLLIQMVTSLDKWKTADLAESWLGGINYRSESNHMERMKNSRYEELDRIWDDLDDSEKTFIIGRIATKDSFWDGMKVLAGLAERLQEKVIELERRLEESQ